MNSPPAARVRRRVPCLFCSLTLLAFALLAACSSAPPFDAAAVASEWHAYMQRDYVLRPGDRLSVLVTGVDAGPTTETGDAAQEMTVSPSGSIDLPELSAPLQASGKSVGSLRTLALEAYKAQGFESARVSISLLEASAQAVYVCGEVFRPGPVAYVPGLTMTQAIATAGSFNYTVKHSDIRILRIAKDGTARTFRVNMDSVLLEESPDFLLLPGDVVYAQTSGVADVGNWVDLYIRRMLPFTIGGPALGTVE